MKIDVSEMKTFRACRRQWQLSSRNKFHLQPIATPPQLAFGTLFHESLAQLYLGVSYDKVMQMVDKERNPGTDIAIVAMLRGYYENVLGADLERFKVLDIEHHFDIPPLTSEGEYLFPFNSDGSPSLTVCGSIDMIVVDKQTNEVFGFEHKTCKNFRSEDYIWMDEQPRVYTWALQHYIAKLNAQLLTDWEMQRNELLVAGKDDNIPRPKLYSLGGVYLNEVKKLLRSFQYKRTLCTYTAEDLDNFMATFFGECNHIKHMVDDDLPAMPQPSYFGCQMCSFRSICSTYMYKHIDKAEVLDEFGEEYMERTEDHLEEKTERSVSSDQ